MQKSLPVFIALFGIYAAALAQDAPPTEKPVFIPTARPAAAPAQKSPGVLQFLFGSRQKHPPVVIEPTPAPRTAVATPAPRSPKPRATPAPKPRATPAPKPKVTKKEPGADAATAEAMPPPKKEKPKKKPATAETEPVPAKSDAPESAQPAPEKPPTPAPEPPAAGKKPRKGKGTPTAAAKEGVGPPPDADPETKEKFRFDQAKAKAAEDPEVQELKAKADSAVSDEDTRSAQRAYNKALFSKMRKIDGTLDERINSMEAAILKRLGGQ